ncbi:hypothetical protein [Arthrobacter sp. H14]|uniref:hypothetical protein n=1 Tax=Arthrobacter sp. H14 TaxID=1312959 RepID=UPI0004B62936|nr:hypothetical protein [Arthrobacter sp. H14]
MSAQHFDDSLQTQAVFPTLTGVPDLLTDHAAARLHRKRRLHRDRHVRLPGEESTRNPRLDVLVGVNLDGGTIRIVVRGTVTGQNLRAVYVLAKRANGVAEDLDIVVDFRDAAVEPGPLEEILSVSREGRLPASVDPFQSPCRLLVLQPAVTTLAE